MKEQEKSPLKELNEMETNNLADIEFKTVKRMLKKLRRTMDELSMNLKRK